MKETRYTLAKYELTEKEEKVFVDALELALDLSREKNLPDGLKKAFYNVYDVIFDLYNLIDEEFKTKGIILE